MHFVLFGIIRILLHSVRIGNECIIFTAKSGKMKQLIIFVKPFAKYLLLFWVISIAIVSSIPHLPTAKIDTGRIEIRLDYLIHFCEYGVLIFLSLLSFIQKDFRLLLKWYILITIAIIIFAVADEFHQKLIPGRTFNPKDIRSNITGILTGLIFCYFVFRNIADDLNNNKKISKTIPHEDESISQL